MSGVIKYNVLDPPTSGEVAGYALKALGEHAVLPLVVLAVDQQVPPPELEHFTMRIRQFNQPLDGPDTIVGFTEPDRHHVIIEIAPDADQMAHATIVGKS